MEVFFDLACMSTYTWALPKPKYEPFITHKRGTLVGFLNNKKWLFFSGLYGTIHLLFISI